LCLGLVAGPIRRDSALVAAQPNGTVTLLFTDIEGSTRLLQVLGRERYAEALERHRRLLRNAFERHGGYEVDCEGDSFFVAFARAEQAVAAATDAQLALSAVEWAESTALGVRMGLHTGEPLVVAPRYVGLDVHRAARIMAAAHGGQVLLSQTTRALLAPHVTVRDLGEHRLKDLSLPQRLYQLELAGLASEFPALRTLENRPMNLPVQPTPFVGREREVAEVAGLVGRSGVRLLTLTGPGGTGKTRLALQAAADLVERFDGGVFLVSLAPISDPELVVATIARTLGVREQPGDAPLDTLARALAGRELLLVLDNFEQVAAAAVMLAELLAAAPSLTVLVTSRVPLSVSAERVFGVPPLSVPDTAQLPSAERLSQYEAVVLFVERAKAADRGFAVTDENAPAVAEICVRLDGLPLALELAAARVRTLPPRALLARLDQSLQLLTGGARDLDERQRTLRATIQWSYELLTNDERALFARLGVFVGGFRVDAGHALAGEGGELELIDRVGSLVEQSLLRQQEDPDGEPRYSMLETIREFALEQLALDESDRVRRAHAIHYLDVARRQGEQFWGPDQEAAQARLDRDHANLRAAAGWCIEQRDAHLLAGYVDALWRFWAARGYQQEARGYIEAALAMSDGLAPEARLPLLRAATWTYAELGERKAATQAAEHRLALARSLGDRGEICRALGSLGATASWRRDHARARELLSEAIALSREIGDDRALATTRHNLAEIEVAVENYPAAASLYEQALAGYRKLGDWGGVAHALTCLGAVCLMQRSYERAERYYRQALPNLHLESTSVLSVTLIELGVVAFARGDAQRAAHLVAAGEALRRRTGFVPQPDTLELHERETAQLRELRRTDLAIGDAWDEGEQMTAEQAVIYALDDPPAELAERSKLEA
jgi:predicted ATPase/class 3 adenylate cyclase